VHTANAIFKLCLKVQLHSRFKASSILFPWRYSAFTLYDACHLRWRTATCNSPTVMKKGTNASPIPPHIPDAVHPVVQAPLHHAAQLLPAEQRALGVSRVCEHQRSHRVSCKCCCLCCCIQSCCVVLLLVVQVYWQRSDLVAHLKACSGSERMNERATRGVFDGRGGWLQGQCSKQLLTTCCADPSD
jgi:hypothetical protein